MDVMTLQQHQLVLPCENQARQYVRCGTVKATKACRQGRQSAPPRPRLTTWNRTICLSLEELAAALKGLPRGKAPGREGIPYEFYQRFWPQVGSLLADALQDAFSGGAESALPASTLHGRITLLYKGKGADRAAPASYRPITLLNTDYKLAARIIASRMGPLLSQVVDATQTAFLPDRWIGDNVLAHLEEIAYLERAQQPGVMLLLDFEKAFDRLDRPWIERCMAAVGFGPGLRRWVRLLHSGTTAAVAMNGCHTAAFPVSSGVFFFFFFFFFLVLKGKVRTGVSEQGRTLPSITRTRIGQTLGIVLGTLDTLQSRRLAE